MWKWNYNSLWFTIFDIFKIFNTGFKHLQAIGPSFVTMTKAWGNKIGETFCERSKQMCTVFEIDEQKDLSKPATFSKSANRTCSGKLNSV